MDAGMEIQHTTVYSGVKPTHEPSDSAIRYCFLPLWVGLSPEAAPYSAIS